MMRMPAALELKMLARWPTRRPRPRRRQPQLSFGLALPRPRHWSSSRISSPRRRTGRRRGSRPHKVSATSASSHDWHRSLAGQGRQLSRQVFSRISVFCQSNMWQEGLVASPRLWASRNFTVSLLLLSVQRRRAHARSRRRAGARADPRRLQTRIRGIYWSHLDSHFRGSSWLSTADHRSARRDKPP